MKKRLFPILIAMLMVLVMMPMTAGTVFADDTVYCDGFYCILDKEHNTATICGGGGGHSLVIPETVTYKDKTITDETYTGDTYSVTEIKDRAYYMSQLSTVTLPANLQIIGSEAFEGCSELETVSFADNNELTTIGNSAFEDCTELETVSFGDNNKLTTIGNDAFYDCKELKTVSFGENCGLKLIDCGAFSGCSSLTSIDIPSSVNEIGSGAFSYTGLTSIVLPEGLESIYANLFCGCGSLTEVTIPSTVTSIEAFAFYDCASLETITIPASVTSIGVYAFAQAPLTTVNFGGTEEQWAAITEDGKPINVPVNYGAFTVTFLDGQGNTLKTETVKKGEDATAPDVPTREGYKFVGWDKDFNNITSDLTVKAKWKQGIVSINGAKVALSGSSFTYNANVQKPTIKTIKGLPLKEGTDYTAKWSNAYSKNAGTYSVTITGQGDYTGTTKATYTINKAANPLAMKPKTATVKYKKLKKKAQPLAVTKVINFKKQLKDKKTYTLSSAKKGSKSFKKYFKINKTTGKVTVKKGLKKGIYKVKVKVKAAGNANYKPSALKTVTFKVKVK